MVVLEKFAFLEMPRTGSTHIKKLLLRMLGGKRIGMHEAATPEVLSTHQAFLGSIRNPWDWYVSQWTIGCGRAGLVRSSSTRSGHKIEKGPSRGLVFDPAPWIESYRDPEAKDVDAFRLWLRLMCTPEQTQTAFPQHFGRSDLRRYAGYYTYRFATLFCRNRRQVHRPSGLADYEALEAFIEEHYYITHMVHTENMANELEAALLDIGVDLSTEQKEMIHSTPPTNRSHRSLPREAFYDDELRDLVSDRDRMIIERFGFNYPNSGWTPEENPPRSPGNPPRSPFTKGEDVTP
jgi:hypothetical protein